MSDISKLPKWAQAHIEKLQRVRDDAVRTLNEFVDDQTPSSISYDEWVFSGEKLGPSTKVRYIQTHRLKINHAGVLCHIMLTRPDDGQRMYGIEIIAEDENRMDVASFVPTSRGTLTLMGRKAGER